MTTRTLLLFALPAIALCGLISAQSNTEKLADATDKLQADLDRAINAYQESEKAISSEKLELLKKTNELDQKLIKRRQELRELNARILDRKQRSSEVRQELESIEGQASYIDGVLREFSRNFMARIHVAEQQVYLDELTAINESVRSEEGTYDQRISLQLDSVRAGLARLGQVIGGYQFAGSALDESGEVKSGTVTLFGPTAYFLSEESQTAGILQANPGTIEPRLASISKKATEQISAFSESRSGPLPIDATSNALALERESGDLLAHIRKGGWVGYVIIALGLISLLLLLIKLFVIQREPSRAPSGIPKIAIDAVEGRTDQAITAANGHRPSVTQLLKAGIENVHERTELLEESMLSEILEYKLKLERFVPIIALTAATAPLLGLLGTVVGMIKTFTLITVFGTGDAKSLSSGISEALVTTELGLVIAVPSLIAHGIIQHMIKTRTSALERTAFDFVKTCSSSGVRK